MITYSFIIPHHNSPDLLNRCLDSIPQREDIQILVIDDNSLENKRPNIKRKDVEIVSIDAIHTKGAGHARNVGLEHAKGKWLLFPDCDDYYSDGFILELDKCSGIDFDAVYFNYNIINNETGAMCQTRDVQDVISQFSGTQEEVDIVKYRNKVPWSKMIRKVIIDKFKLYFEEVPNGNDMLFSYYIASFISVH